MFFSLRRWFERQFRAFSPRQSRRRPARQRTLHLDVEGLEDRSLLSASIFATGSDAGGPPVVTVYDAATGQQTLSFLAYPAAFTGGVRVAVGDVTGSGTQDIITSTGPGGGSLVRVFDSTNGQLLQQFSPFGIDFTGGANIAAGDVTGSGTDNVIVGADAGGGPAVDVFSQDDSLLSSFMAYDPSFTGGVRVAAGDINGNGQDEIITGPGAGGSPFVKVFDGTTGSSVNGFMALDANFTGGINVAAGDLTGNGHADIVVGTGAGGGPYVAAFNGLDNSVLDNYFAYDPTFTGGVRVATATVNGQGEIITVPGQGGGPEAVAVDPMTGTTVQQFVCSNSNIPTGFFGAGDSSNTASPTAVATHFLVVTPINTQAGAPTPVLVEALSASNEIVTNYTGTVQLTSSDANATLPAAYTFQASDHGRHVFQVTFVNTGSQSVTATDTTTSTITGTASTNVDPADVATHLLLLVPDDVQAGAATPVTVLALDASNHLVPNYGGTVQLTSSDTGATLPAAYTFQVSDHGRHTFQVTFATTGSQTVTATDTTTSTITGSVTANVNPADVATHFGVVISPKSSPQVGQAVSIGVAALDASNQIVSNYSGTVQLTSTDSNATLPAAYTFQASDHGVHFFKVTFGSTGSQSVTATDTTTSSITGSVTVTVNPADVATQFAVKVLGNVQVGQPVSVLVAALDASNHVVTSYTGTVQVTSSDTGATLPAAYTFQGSDHGQHVFQVTFAGTGSQTVTATDTTTSSITGSATVTVNPADVATQFAVKVLSDDVQAGQAVSVVVAALDASNHVVSNYSGTVQLTSSDTGATLPAAYTFQASDHGSHVFQVTFSTTGSQTVTATDTTTSSITGSATVQVNAADVATHFAVAISPQSPQAGQAVSVGVVALDASNHILPNYTGTVQLTSSDANATLPAAYTFQASDHGRHILQVTFGTSGSQTVTATDTTTSSITGSVTATVTPAAVATHFGVKVLSDNVQVGQAVSVVVTALDVNNKPVFGYTGTVTLTSSDTGATLPAAYTFKASDQGSHIFQFTLATTGSQTVTATDSATTPLTGSATVQVNPADVATHFGLLIFPVVPAGQSVLVQVVALDAKNHVVTNYTGTVQLTSSDSSATLPAAYTFQASDEGRRTFQVTFATTGSQTLTATDSADSSLTGSVTIKVLNVVSSTGD